MSSKGSFKSPAKIESELSQAKMEAAATQAKLDAEKPDSAEEAKEKDDVREEAGIPDKVVSAVENKEISFEAFRKKYISVFDQVRDKVHLSRGVVTYKTSVARGQSVGVSTLSSGQQKIVRHMSKATNSAFSTGTDQEEFYRWSLVFALVEYGAQNVSVPKPPRVFSAGPMAEKSEEDLEKYLEHEDVTRKLDLIDDLGVLVNEEIINVIIDLLNATNLAIREDIVNP